MVYYLIEMGVIFGLCVVICLGCIVDLLVFILVVMKVGVVYVLLDFDYFCECLVFIVFDCVVLMFIGKW